MRARDLLSRGRIWGLIAIAALALAAAELSVARAEPPLSTPAGLDVQPFPGTPDASPQTDVAFPALAPAQIKALSVRGSASGAHRGVLAAQPAGHGAAFVPTRPFTDGERVSVQASLSSAAAGTASGAPGATRISFSFTVAVPARLGGLTPAHAASEPITGPAEDANGLTHSFRSEPWLHPPIVATSGTDPDPGMGDIFADAENSHQPGPLILSPQGQLVYFQPVQRSAVFNVRVQTYEGQTVLTYWQGYVQYGVGMFGRDVILNHQYQRVATVYAGHGYSADLHEFTITPQGDAFITAYVPVKADLSAVGGRRHGEMLDSIIQEIDIATGQVLWEWHASGHVHLTETYAKPPSGRPFDWFHVNSVQPLPNGDLLISARQTWALYEINMRTGRIALVIGGKHSSLRVGRGAKFAWQHDAQMQPDGTITVFDNADGETQTEPQSRALRLRLNLKARRITLVHAYTNNPPLLAASQGAVQPLADGHTFVGWGEGSYFSEFAATGRQLFDLWFVFPVQSYRGYRFPWWGQPTTPPSIATATTATGTRVYASWNGATDVASWRVLAGASQTALGPAGQFRKTAQFETAMWVANTAPYFAVQALGSDGQVLATSAAVGR